MPGPPHPLWVAARLTNRDALVGPLGLPHEAADRDIVRTAVARWGEAAPRHLRGAWAYAVQPAVNRVVITRDALGIMPAYWVRDAQGRLHVGDSIQQLARIEGVDLTLDDEFDMSLLLRCPGLLATKTAARGINRVPPGSRLTVDGAAVTIERWWRPESVPQRRRIRVEDAAAELSGVLDDVIGDLVRGLPPEAVSAHVSGGLDSTTLAFAAQRELAERGDSLDCIASWSPAPDLLGPDDLPEAHLAYDERDLVRGLGDLLGVPVLFGAADLTEAPWLAGLEEQVQPRSTLASESHILPQLQQRGVRHVVSGWGGDEFVSFNGRGTNRWIVRHARLRALIDSYVDFRRRGRSVVRAWWSTLAPGLPSWVLERRNAPPPVELRIRRRLDDAERAFPDLVVAARAMRRRLATASNSRDAQLALIDNGHLARRIESWHEAGLRFGVTYHYPLLDLRLVEWALSMPPDVFRVGGHSRRVFRLAAIRWVPREIADTEKDDPVLLAIVRRTRLASGRPVR